MTHAHWMEKMTYTFRPFKELYYDSNNAWRPWPKGFSKLSKTPKEISSYTPLLAHYGYRGPTHVHKKYLPSGRFHNRYPKWDFSSPESVLDTVYFFNGVWSSSPYLMSREGWKNRKYNV